MSLFFLNDPIKESDRSILNNSVLDDNKSDKSDDNEYYNHPLVSGYPYFFGYPPYAYHPNPQSAKSSQKSSQKSNNNTAKRQSSQALDKDVYKLVDFRPKNNLCEDDKNYYIQLDLPGMTKEQIHMELSEDSILIISGERENKYKKAANMKISKMECEYGKFSRSFSIPETADLDKIEAKMENGSLQVIIPKAEPPKNQRRTIQVQ
ncbi:HSP20-like chaperone [Neocallimastix californiae]|uniref:HSP20-like chaperone n=1 Tax=Neocallimastix californiae TaxID=1754190 RepID=A0A1Y2EX47_9FUNG|nr:HSP20-like chaperone [Neocallimastix californiae]|eukprot:ORY76181.1 HSP20-like chaperone [Neocallimastix californiae]